MLPPGISNWQLISPHLLFTFSVVPSVSLFLCHIKMCSSVQINNIKILIRIKFTLYLSYICKKYSLICLYSFNVIFVQSHKFVSFSKRPKSSATVLISFPLLGRKLNQKSWKRHSQKSYNNFTIFLQKVMLQLHIVNIESPYNFCNKASFSE